VLTEHLLLGLLAGGLAVLLARVAIEALVRARPAALPRLDEIGLDAGMIALALGLGLASLALVGSAPAWRLSRDASLRDLATGGRGSSGTPRQQRGRRVLVAVQVAAALVLAIATGLLLRSLSSAYGVDLGFRPDGVTVARLNVPVDVYDSPESRIVFVRQLEEALRAQPEIDAVGTTNLAPLAGGMLTGHFETEAGPGGFELDLRVATSGYLEALGARLVDGRLMCPEEVEQGRAVAVIDRHLAEQLWPSERAIGRRIKTGLGTDLIWHEVVGVVEHLRYQGVRETGRSQVHLPYQSATPLTLVVGSAAPTARVADLVRSGVRNLDRGVPVSDIRSLVSFVEDDVADLSFAVGLMGSFAGLALLLALVGIYGVIAYWVRASARGLGVRLAMGALPGDVLRLVLRQGLLPAIAGTLIGIAGAAALARTASSMLFGVTGTDWRTYASATLVLLAGAALACLLPGLRASRMDPARVLRGD
jgi:predicted permease